MKQIITGIFILVAGLAVQAQNRPEPILDCWDQSFAYNTVVIKPNIGNPDTLMEVEISSEDQARFSGVLPDPHQGWGQMKIDFVLAKSECKIDSARPDLMDCVSHRGLIYIAFDESFEVRKILRQEIGELKFKTSLGQLSGPNGNPIGDFVTALSFVKKGTTDVKSARLDFMTGQDNICRR